VLNELIITTHTRRSGVSIPGDELARRMAESRMCHVVPRSERDIYARALERMELRAHAQGHSFRIVDAEQALIEIGIRKTPTFVHRVQKWVRVLRPSPLMPQAIELGPVERMVMA
jgi:hypothetical protein